MSIGKKEGRPRSPLAEAGSTTLLTPVAAALAKPAHSIAKAIAEANERPPAGSALSLEDAARAARIASPTPRSPVPPSSHKITSVSDLGPLIRAARRRMKMNQQAFADFAGVGRRFISELEAGKSSLEVDKVLRACAAAGVDISATDRASR